MRLLAQRRLQKVGLSRILRTTLLADNHFGFGHEIFDRARVDDFVAGSATPAWVYSYDTACRLKRATGSGHDYQYGYNTTACTGTNSNANAAMNSNRTEVKDNGVVTQSACFDQADRLTSYGAATGAPPYSTRLNTPRRLRASQWLIGCCPESVV